jgi:hypothetical protein
MTHQSREEIGDERASTEFSSKLDADLELAAEQLARIFYRQIIESQSPDDGKYVGRKEIAA